MENQLEKKMENEMETGGIWGDQGFGYVMYVRASQYRAPRDPDDI